MFAAPRKGKKKESWRKKKGKGTSFRKTPFYDNDSFEGGKLQKKKRGGKKGRTTWERVPLWAQFAANKGKKKSLEKGGWGKPTVTQLLFHAEESRLPLLYERGGKGKGGGG